MESEADSGDEYDFYPCLVDGQPASIYANLRYEAAQPDGAGTRYTVAVRMTAPGAHGIGTAEEADALNAVEESLIERARELGITYVGRIRTHGVWETVLYGPAGHVDALHATATAGAGDRRIDVRSADDPGWSYYRELLLPDAERRRWMDDRRMVQILSDKGDRVAQPRRVDHWLYFTTEQARRTFVTAAARERFELGETVHADNKGEHAFGVSVHRVDAIELEHIHEVVMILVDAATASGGIYDRWQSSIEAD